MARLSQDVTETELQMLQVCWDQGPVSRRQILDVLYPRGGPAQYATVQKLLERLEAKGYVTHTKDEHGLRFTATVSREELINRRLQDMADKLCGGSLTPLLMNLVRTRPVTPEELDELRSLVRQLKQQAQPDRPSKD